MALTFSTLKQFATDQMEDASDDKAVRRAGRIVNQAARRVAGERLWAWYLRPLRIILKPRIQVGGVSMSALTNTLRLLSGIWESAAASYSFHFSGDTDVMRIKTRDSSTQLTTFSNEVYVSSTDASNAIGYLVRDRYRMDANFRCLAEDLHEKDYFGPVGELSRRDLTMLRQTYTPSSGSPIGYTLQLNTVTQLWELAVWQWPDRLTSADIWHYVWPAELSSDNDVLDWDPNQSEVIYAAVHLKVIEERRLWDQYKGALDAYHRAVRAAASSDRKTLGMRLAGAQPARMKRMSLSSLFTSE